MLRQFVIDSLGILRSPRVGTFERHTRDDGRTAVIAIVVGAVIVTSLQLLASVFRVAERAAQREAIERQFGAGPFTEMLRVLETPGALVVLGLGGILLTLGIWIGLPYLLGRALGGSGTPGSVAYAVALGYVPLSILDGLLGTVLTGSLQAVFLCLSLGLDAARLYLLYAGLRGAMKLDAGRAALAAGLPFLVMIVASCGVAVVAGVLLALMRGAR